MQVYFNESTADAIAAGTAPAPYSHLTAATPVHNGFSSVPATLWFMVVTLLTVGYGDLVPTTAAGQIITSAAMVVAMLALALPISVVGTNFTQARRRVRIVCGTVR